MAKKQTPPPKAKEPPAKAAKKEKKPFKKFSKGKMPEDAEQLKLTQEVPALPVNIFDDKDNTLAIAHKTLNAIFSARKLRPTGFASLSDIRRSFFPLPHFYMRYLFGTHGIPQHCLIDLIGAEHLGKTTMGLTILSWAIKYAQGFGLWVETESKPFLPTHVWRIMDSDPMKAVTMERKGLTYKPARSLDEMVEVIIDWVDVMRGRKTRGKEMICVPMQQPLFIFVDTISKLMTPQEAAGFYHYAKYLDEEKMKKKKAIGEGSNLNFSKFFHEFTRKLPAFLSQNNAVMIAAHHQNDDIDMGGGGLSSFFPESYTELFNKKKIGGRASNQNAAFQIILATQGQVKNEAGQAIGKLVRMRMDKNSFGPHGRIISYELHNDYMDAPNWWEPVIQWDAPMLKWMMDEQHLDVTNPGPGRWSSPTLNKFNVPAAEICRELDQKPELLSLLGNKLRIEGYYDPVQEAKDSLQQAAEIPVTQ